MLSVNQSTDSYLDKCGIYKILNKINGKFYLGSAKNVRERLVRHLCDLRNNRHHSITFQRAWNKYSDLAFFIEIIEECEEALLKIREQYYLDSLKPYLSNIGYNIGRQACGGDNLSSNMRKEEIIKKISKTIKDNLAKLTLEEKRKIWGKPGKLNHNFGKRWNLEQRNLARERQKGVKFSTETLAKISKSVIKHWTPELRLEKSKKVSGDNNPFSGKTHSLKTKKHLSEKQRQRFANFSKEDFKKIGEKYRKPVIADNLHFESVKAAAEHFKVTSTAIYNRIKANKAGYYYLNKTPGSFKRRVLVNFQEFESISLASKALHITVKCINSRIKANRDGYKYLD